MLSSFLHFSTVCKYTGWVCSIFACCFTITMYIPFVLFTSLVVQKRKLKALIWPPIHFVVKFNKPLNMNNLFACVIMSENNNKRYLVCKSFFYKWTCLLHCSSYIFWLDRKYCETVQQQHLNQCINIYLPLECHKTSFICCFIVTTKNLIW